MTGRDPRDDRIAELEAEIKRVRWSNKTWRESAEVRRKRIVELESENEELRLRVGEIGEECERLHAGGADLVDERDKLKELHSQGVKDAQLVINNLRRENEELQTQLACAADALNTTARVMAFPEVKNPYGDLRLRDAILAIEPAHFRALRKKAEERDTTQAESDAFLETIAAMDEERTNLREAVESLEASIAMATDENNKLRAENARLKSCDTCGGDGVIIPISQEFDGAGDWAEVEHHDEAQPCPECHELTRLRADLERAKAIMRRAADTGDALPLREFLREETPEPEAREEME